MFREVQGSSVCLNTAQQAKLWKKKGSAYDPYLWSMLQADYIFHWSLLMIKLMMTLAALIQKFAETFGLLIYLNMFGRNFIM